MRRTYAAALAGAVVGGGLALMASLTVWCRASYQESEAFPAIPLSFTGADLTASGAAGAVGLACAVAYIAGGRILRLVAGVIALGSAAVLAVGSVGWLLDPDMVLAPIVDDRVGGAGASAVTIVDRPILWPVLVLVAAAALAVSGALAIGTSGRWPRMSARYQRQAGRSGGTSIAPTAAGPDGQPEGGRDGTETTPPGSVASAEQGAGPVDDAPGIESGDVTPGELWAAQNRGEDPTA